MSALEYGDVVSETFRVTGLRLSWGASSCPAFPTRGVSAGSMFALTVACAASSSQDIVTSYETIVDRHISEILPLWSSNELNFEWSSRLKSQRVRPTKRTKRDLAAHPYALHPLLAQFFNTREFGQLMQQEMQVPWPLLNREVLLQCERKVDHKAQRVTSNCRSVEHAEAPITERAVRLSLRRTAWELTPLLGDRTKLSLTLELPASSTAGVPKFIIDYCQKRSLKDSVTDLLNAAARLKLPVHRDTISWARPKAAANATQRHAHSDPAETAGASCFTVLFSHATVRALGTIGIALALVQGSALGLYLAHRRASQTNSSSWRGASALADLRRFPSDGELSRLAGRHESAAQIAGLRS